ncbi:DUF805 domain-containing protein [Hymenobacter caeli]|uniref:Uncharacterized membrane protein YhaH (DUF805 family) n=1 Tax=Hymenobacter caeli TaxID=2735894 RepID=A0ABX2FMA5_9BACT|nr:DUF805 domain-containing protein [Hymenobacter caeli]NRT18267.1 uncharacterized membrane protein YhaH (DUF805 family) [Hymenobacter caeli]
MAFFTARGRLRRRHYFGRIALLYAAGIGCYALPTLLPQIPTIEPVAVGGLVAVGYLLIIQMLQRLHDLDLRAWWALTSLLPVVSYVLGAGLQLVPGTVGPNRFGPDPKRPGLRPAAPAPPALGEDLASEAV